MKSTFRDVARKAIEDTLANWTAPKVRSYWHDVVERATKTALTGDEKQAVDETVASIFKRLEVKDK